MKKYLFEAEKHHRLTLPLSPSEIGLSSEHPAQQQLDQVLHKLLHNDARPFWRIEWRKVLTPEGAACTCLTLDIFDRPLYVLVDNSYTKVHLQAPLLKGLKVDQVASALAFLEGIGSDLVFKAAPRGTLAAHANYSFDTFVKEADMLLSGFRKEAREAVLLVREHLETKRCQQGYMESAA